MNRDILEERASELAVLAAQESALRDVMGFTEWLDDRCYSRDPIPAWWMDAPVGAKLASAPLQSVVASLLTEPNRSAELVAELRRRYLEYKAPRILADMVDMAPAMAEDIASRGD